LNLLICIVIQYNVEHLIQLVMGTVNFEQVISRGCGIDVDKKTVVATINGKGLKRSTREYGAFTSSLTE